MRAINDDSDMRHAVEKRLSRNVASIVLAAFGYREFPITSAVSLRSAVRRETRRTVLRNLENQSPPCDGRDARRPSLARAYPV